MLRIVLRGFLRRVVMPCPTCGTRESHVWDKLLLRLGEVVLFVVVVKRFVVLVAEDLQVADDACLLFGRDVILAIAIPVVLRAAAKDVKQPFAYGTGEACASGNQQAFHASGNPDGFLCGEETAVVVLAGSRKDGGVMGETRGCQLRYGMAQAVVGEQAVVLETDCPILGCEGICQVLHNSEFYG